MHLLVHLILHLRTHLRPHRGKLVRVAHQRLAHLERRAIKPEHAIVAAARDNSPMRALVRSTWPTASLAIRAESCTRWPISSTDEDSCSLSFARARLSASGGDLRELIVALTQTDAFLYRTTDGATP